MHNDNFYRVLGVDANADNSAIKEAYRKLAFAYHPDRNAGSESAANRMKQINEAYAVLSNPEKRKQYDAMLNQFGEDAGTRFRQTYSQQDIFNESDIQQIFEEMARAFGLRGFNDLFSDFHGTGSKHFQSSGPGFHFQGVLFSGRFTPGRATTPGGKLFGRLAGKMIEKMVGTAIPQKGGDIHDRIVLTAEFARDGGPYAYHHRERDKKLVVHVPAGVRNGQVIRLAGLGHDGANGASPGDMYLTVRVREPLVKKIKHFFGVAS